MSEYAEQMQMRMEATEICRKLYEIGAVEELRVIKEYADGAIMMLGKAKEGTK